MSGFYNRIKSTNIPRSSFDLSHTKQFTLDMGQLIPCDVIPVVPNDIIDLGAQSVIRFTPMVAPSFTDINCYVHYFFVPYRLLMLDSEGTWMDFISGGLTGDSKPSLPLADYASGSIHCTSFTSGDMLVNGYGDGLPNGTQKFTLWDYLGFPVASSGGVDWSNADCSPSAFPFRAYSKIFNDWYRDPILQQKERHLDSSNIAFRNMQKDYFISALPSPQLGTPPTLSIFGSPFVQYADTAQATGVASSVGLSSNVLNLAADNSGSLQLGTDSPNRHLYGSGGANTNLKPLYVDLTNASTSVTVNELRVLYATQRFMERNMVSGGNMRMQDFLVAHFGTAPNDETLQRAEYLGGSKFPILINQVAQTSETSSNSPQGNLTGEGVAVSSDHMFKYRAKEFGIIMGIMSIMPDTLYYGGIDKEWLKRTKEEFLFPEFAELGASEVYTAEIFADPSSVLGTNGIFGYQGRYDEYRTMPSKICAGMQDTYFGAWNLARIFTNSPNLNSDFISAKWLSTAEGKRIFAVQEDDTTDGTASVPATRNIICHYASKVTAIRPLPYYPIA